MVYGDTNEVFIGLTDIIIMSNSPQGVDSEIDVFEGLRATSSRMRELIARAEELLLDSREFIVDEETGSLDTLSPVDLNAVFRPPPRFASEVNIIGEGGGSASSVETLPLRGGSGRGWLGSPPPATRFDGGRWSIDSDTSTIVETWEDPYLTPSYFFDFDDDEDLADENVQDQETINI